MKWVALIILLAAIPPLTSWLRGNPGATRNALVLMGFLPWALDFHLWMAVISEVGWPGYVTGAEITVLDALTLAVYFSLPRARHPLPFRISMALYFFAVLLSVFQARYSWLAAVYYLWQLARMFLVYATVTNACATDRLAVHSLMTGMVVGLILGSAFRDLGTICPGHNPSRRNRGSPKCTWYNVTLRGLSVFCVAVGRRPRMAACRRNVGRYHCSSADDIESYHRSCPVWVCSRLCAFCSAAVDIAEGASLVDWRSDCYALVPVGHVIFRATVCHPELSRIMTSEPPLTRPQK